MSQLKKFYFVYKHDYKVIKDYISSLNIFDKCIELTDVNTYYNTYDIFIFGQMWIGDILIKQICDNPNAMFLNVEMLSESNRYEYILKLLKHNITILDYSSVNIAIINSKIKELDIQFTRNILHLPYQYNSTENKFLQCDTNCFEYDVGVINAIPGKLEPGKTSRRTELWNKLLQTDWKVVNIMGWGEERDNIIKKCKIILNIHHFDSFTIFEEIRCCRLLFANKIIISEKSLVHEQLDIRDNVIWCDYDDILLQTKVVLDDWGTYNYNKDMGQIAANRKEILEHSYKLITGRNMSSETDISPRKWYQTEGIKIKSNNERLTALQKKINIKYGSLLDEAVEQKLIIEYLEPTDIVLELGGNIGRVSSIIASIINDDENLLVFESSPQHYKELLENRNNNKFKFKLEGKALSKQKLYQYGWDTYTQDEYDINPSKNLMYEIATITFDEIKKKYSLDFNTLVIDCEGAFYYIIQDFPEILNGIKKIIIENDYPTWERKMFVEDILEKNGFKSIKKIPLDKAYWHFHKDQNIINNFYEVFINTSSNKTAPHTQTNELSENDPEIPIVIISWNCLSFIRNFISQIKNLPNPIIILDNNSSYDNLHKYYDHLECELKGKITIKRLTENYGHTVYITRRDLLPEVYILTDPDLQLNIHMPSNVSEILYNISCQYKMFKVGLSLDISDSDKFSHNKNYALDPDGSGWKNIKEWETQFWINRIPHDKYELYHAVIDTTFTLVNWNYFAEPNNCNVYRGIRIAGNFTCIHLPWYNNFLENNLLNAELTQLKTDNKSSTIMKTVTLSVPIPDTNKDIIAAARQMAINLWGSL